MLTKHWSEKTLFDLQSTTEDLPGFSLIRDFFRRHFTIPTYSPPLHQLSYLATRVKVSNRHVRLSRGNPRHSQIKVRYGQTRLPGHKGSCWGLRDPFTDSCRLLSSRGSFCFARASKRLGCSSLKQLKTKTKPFSNYFYTT